MAQYLLRHQRLDAAALPLHDEAGTLSHFLTLRLADFEETQARCSKPLPPLKDPVPIKPKLTEAESVTAFAQEQHQRAKRKRKEKLTKLDPRRLSLGIQQEKREFKIADSPKRRRTNPLLYAQTHPARFQLTEDISGSSRQCTQNSGGQQRRDSLKMYTDIPPLRVPNLLQSQGRVKSNEQTSWETPGLQRSAPGSTQKLTGHPDQPQRSHLPIGGQREQIPLQQVAPHRNQPRTQAIEPQVRSSFQHVLPPVATQGTYDPRFHYKVVPRKQGYSAVVRPESRTLTTPVYQQGQRIEMRDDNQQQMRPATAPGPLKAAYISQGGLTPAQVYDPKAPILNLRRDLRMGANPPLIGL